MSGRRRCVAPLSKANPGVWLTATNCDKTNGKPYNCIRITYAKLVSLVQAYVSGYIGAGGSKATVAVGTNNDGTWGPKTYTAAKKAADWWTEVVQPLRDSAPAGITYVAADDIEPGFNATYSQTKTWVNGYLTAAGSVSGLRLIDNGSADGCPTTIGATGGKCPPQGDGQWTQARRVALDSDPHTDVLPQIYYTVQAEQWANLALQAKGALHFAGSLTELRASGGTFSPSQGWIALWNELTAANFTPKHPRGHGPGRHQVAPRGTDLVPAPAAAYSRPRSTRRPLVVACAHATERLRSVGATRAGWHTGTAVAAPCAPAPGRLSFPGCSTPPRTAAVQPDVRTRGGTRCRIPRRSTPSPRSCSTSRRRPQPS